MAVNIDLMSQKPTIADFKKIIWAYYRRAGAYEPAVAAHA